MSGIALPIDGVATPAANNRVADGALYLGRTDRPLGALSGVRPGSEPVVTFSGLTATLSPFVGVADPATSLAVGAYRVAFLANETFTINAANATNGRLDRVDVQVPDDPAGASPLAAIIKYTAGTASATPALPNAPARSFFLGAISVPSTSNGGAPSWSTTGIARTVASGGILPVDSTSFMPANPYSGQYIHDLTTGVLRRWSSSVSRWRAPGSPRAKVVYSDATGRVTQNDDFTPMGGWQTTSPAFGRHMGISNNGVTVTDGGDVTVMGSAEFEVGNGAGRRGLFPCVNGALVSGEGIRVPASSGLPTRVSFAAMVPGLSAGDVVSLVPYQNDGGVLHMMVGNLSVVAVG